MFVFTIMASSSSILSFPANHQQVGPLGHDIIAKIICKQGVGYIMESDTHENHMVNLRGPITLRHLRFKLTDYEGNVVNLRGTSISFCIYLDG